MSAIPASSVSMKTMADGTLRISFDVEPAQAQDAFKLFSAPGTQVAIAALKDGSFLAQPVAGYPEYTQDIPEPHPDLPQPRVQLGNACYRTVLWCSEPSFWDFIILKYPDFERIKSKDEAALFVKWLCDVKSRKELDTNPEAKKIWNREIRQPYADYLKRMEVA